MIYYHFYVTAHKHYAKPEKATEKGKKKNIYFKEKQEEKQHQLHDKKKTIKCLTINTYT